MIEDALGAHPAVQLCAAIGAPDAYAGELPVAFATLVPGASVTEEELLAFTAARVDEAPARPKSVTIIEQMPMTNVGKIYKPELRQLAACGIARAVVDQVCAGLGLDPAARPRVQAHGDSALQVLIDPQTAGPQAAALQAQLAQVLGRLPIKVQLVLQQQ
ncbi:MAG: AMP-dependent synthetase and ligase [Polaromonas sp.]|nr:AMP-dependent synthetase and ligase [Polaromonas sp.]